MAKDYSRTAGTAAGVSVNPFLVTAKRHSKMEYNIYIHGVIEDVADFVDALEVLNMAEEGDVVVIHLNSCGGSLAATDSLVDAITHCEGTVVCKVTGDCMSAATMILLAVDEWVGSRYTNFMVHSVSFGGSGRHMELVDYVTYVDRQTRQLMKETYGAMFTDEEYEAMFSGKEFYMNLEEFTERLERNKLETEETT